MLGSFSVFCRGRGLLLFFALVVEHEMSSSKRLLSVTSDLAAVNAKYKEIVLRNMKQPLRTKKLKLHRFRKYPLFTCTEGYKYLFVWL